MSGTVAPAPLPVSELALVTADLLTILDSSQAAAVSKKAQVHAMVTALKADIAAAEKALGMFTPAADLKAEVVWVEKEVGAVASGVKTGALNVWHKVGSLAFGAAMGGVILAGLAWAGVHFF